MAEVLHDLVDDLVRLFKVRGVRGITLGLDAECGDFGFGSLAVLVDHQVREGNVGTFRGEFQCDGLADAAGGTRNDSHFSFE